MNHIIIDSESSESKFRNIGNPQLILDRAINTIGSEKRFITWMACTHSDLNFPIAENEIEKVDILKWVRIANFLGIPMDAYQFGYSQIVHIQGLIDKISSGNYIFPKGKRFFVLKRKMKGKHKKELVLRRMYFGKRLHLKVRFYELLADLLFLPKYLRNSFRSRITLFVSRIAYNRLAHCLPDSGTVAGEMLYRRRYKNEIERVTSNYAHKE